MKWISGLIPWVLVALAIILSFAIPHSNNGYVHGYTDSLLLWLIFFNIGIQGIWEWFAHTVCHNPAARHSGCESNPFQFKWAWCNLSLGASGFVALWFGPQYWLALVIFATGLFFGAAFERTKHMVRSKALAFSHFSNLLITDLAVPVALWVLVVIHVA